MRRQTRFPAKESTRPVTATVVGRVQTVNRKSRACPLARAAQDTRCSLGFSAGSLLKRQNSVLETIAPTARAGAETPIRGCAARCAVAALTHRRWHPNHSGATPLIWGGAPDSLSSSRKGTALPHIGRHSREPRSAQYR